MHDLRGRDAVRRLAARGVALRTIARDLGIPPTTVHRWAHSRSLQTDLRAPVRCFVCDGESPPARIARAYVYVLGQYLGDGHLVTSSRTPVLRIYACMDYPRILDELTGGIEIVRGRRPGTVGRADTAHVRAVQSYWMHWPCLLPQHGPGRKHERPIRLVDWQQTLVEQHPWQVIRGLIHSDGCRSINRITTRGRTYSYPRYLFANESRDILQIMGSALDLAGVEWRYNRPNSISVARRDSVARMEHHVGPKS